MSITFIHYLHQRGDSRKRINHLLGFKMKYLLMMPLVAMIASGCATGICTDRLIRSNQVMDPPVERYHAAYLHKSDIVLEYSVRNTEQRLSERYWAAINIPNLSDYTSVGAFTIHRRPLRDSKRKRLTPIPLVDRQQDAQKIDAIPAVFVTAPEDILGLSVRYRNPQTGRTETRQANLRNRYLPPSKYLKVVATWPFAFVGDLLTLPFVLPWAIGGWSD